MKEATSDVLSNIDKLKLVIKGLYSYFNI